jgi:hypothetical protein
VGKDYLVQDGDVLLFKFNVWGEDDREQDARGEDLRPCKCLLATAGPFARNVKVNVRFRWPGYLPANTWIGKTLIRYLKPEGDNNYCRLQVWQPAALALKV